MPTVVVTLQPPSSLLPVGTTTFGPSSLDSTYSSITLTLPRNAGWADSGGVEILEFLVDVSFDSGTTWQTWCGFGVAGGVISGTDKNNNPFTITQHTMTEPIPAPCEVRGRLINKTSGTITALSVTAVCS